MKTIVIQRRIPSQNQSTYSHWIHYKTERDLWFSLLRTQLVPRTSPIPGKVHIRIVSFRTRMLDYANLVGGAKPIPDCLKRLNWITDDSDKWFQCDYQQRLVKAEYERTQIDIADVPDLDKQWPLIVAAASGWPLTSPQE